MILLMEELLHQLRLVVYPLFTRFHLSQVVQDFSHQQYKQVGETLKLSSIHPEFYIGRGVSCFFLKELDFSLGDEEDRGNKKQRKFAGLVMISSCTILPIFVRLTEDAIVTTRMTFTSL